MRERGFVSIVGLCSVEKLKRRGTGLGRKLSSRGFHVYCALSAGGLGPQRGVSMGGRSRYVEIAMSRVQ